MSLDDVDALRGCGELATVQVVDALRAVAVDGAQLLDARSILQHHADGAGTCLAVLQQIGAEGQDAGSTVLVGITHHRMPLAVLLQGVGTQL